MPRPPMKSDAADIDAPATAKIHPATLALLLATFFWGCGFTWASGTPPMKWTIRTRWFSTVTISSPEVADTRR